MTLVHRVLHPEPITSLGEYVERMNGGEGLDAARAAGAEAVIAELEAAGLRGRGGAGFPTGRKWRTVRDNRSDVVPATVVVNGAEGEPGTFKDRTILRNNPYHVLEGALIAATVVGANEVVVALKRSFTTEVALVRAAMEEVRAAGWADGVELTVFEGPAEYLYGEETALLEVIDGRPPFPRIAPPFRRGAVEVVEGDPEDVAETGLSATVDMAGESDEQLAPPALVDNVETLANVPRIVARGAAWFRTEGTEASPGTIVCTVTGQVAHPGVGEVIMGTTLREAIDEIAGGVLPRHEITAVLPGTAAAAIPVERLDTPLTYEDMAEAGSALGSAGFIVLDDSVTAFSAAAGVSRFLAVESCGQCTPCKQDGLALRDLLAALARGEDADVDTIRDHAATIADGARCYLATQHQLVVDGLLRSWPAGPIEAQEPLLVAELVDIDADGAVVVDEGHTRKQPDWSYDEEWSGKTPADE